MPELDEALFTFTVRSNYMYETYGPRVRGATEYRHFPVHLCMPSPAGQLFPTERLVLCDDERNTAPGVITPLCLWKDGSVRAWDITFPVDVSRQQSRVYTVHRATIEPPSAPLRMPRMPHDFTLYLTLAEGAELRAVVHFPVLNSSDEAAVCFEDEQEFELRSFGEYGSFKGVLIRKAWNWYPGIELALRLTNCMCPETIVINDMRLEFDLPGEGRCRYVARHARFTADGPRTVDGAMPFAMRADAGGIHVDDIARFGEMQTDYPAYERGTYLEATENWLGMADDESGWVLIVPDALERMPKGWTIENRHVTIQVHPDWAKPLDWRQGMSLFQRVYLSRLDTSSSAGEFEDEGLRWIRQPLVEIAPDLYRNAGWQIPFCYDPVRYPKTEYDILRTWGFSWSTGTFDWGDDYLPGKGTRNHEYDFIANALKEFARTGQPEVYKLGRAATEHMIYTDFVPCSADPWKEGGVPAHCSYHTTGSAYPSHMWVEGLLLYYLMTGDRYALQVAVRVGDFFLKYVDERFQVVEGTGREMGWTLVALGALYDITGEERFLAGARKTVDRYLDARVENFFPTDATFAVGVGLIGLDRIRPYYRGDDIARFIPAVLDWMMAHRQDGIGLFDYWYDSERKSMYHIQTHLPEALNIGYQLTGDTRYLKAAWRLFMIHQGGGVLTVENPLRPAESGIAGGYHISWTMGCLASFAERGWLDNIQYYDPEPQLS